MSWNNALPWWVYDVMNEHHIALMQCAFESEWYSGTSKKLPEHVIEMSPATFKSWDENGWNYGKD